MLTISKIIGKLEEIRAQSNDDDLPVFVEVDFADETVRVPISDIVTDEITNQDDICTLIQL